MEAVIQKKLVRLVNFYRFHELVMSDFLKFAAYHRMYQINLPCSISYDQTYQKTYQKDPQNQHAESPTAEQNN